MQRGLTLIGMLVAAGLIAILLVVASAAFDGATAVSTRGMAVSDLLSQAAAIERALRADFERASREGFLAIRCVGVRNDVNRPGPPLAPWLPPDAELRVDQIVFFTHGAATVSTFRGTAGVNRKGSAAASRVYWGPAVQLPAAPEVERLPGDDSVVWAIDPVVDRAAPLVPWSIGPRLLVRTRFQRNATDPPGDYRVEGQWGGVDATQPRAERWLLARQQVLLADDGGSPNVFLFTLGGRGFRSTAWIGDDVIVNGRVDAAASRLPEIRSHVLDGGWEAMAETLFYPRAEPAVPGMHRVDQALTSHGIAYCSSISIEWTAGGPDSDWHGLGSPKTAPGTTSAGAIEAMGGSVREFFFGFGEPWPAAIRFTMTLHDPRGTLVGGRVFQFVVNPGGG